MECKRLCRCGARTMDGEYSRRFTTRAATTPTCRPTFLQKPGWKNGFAKWAATPTRRQPKRETENARLLTLWLASCEGNFRSPANFCGQRHDHRPERGCPGGLFAGP